MTDRSLDEARAWLHLALAQGVRPSEQRALLAQLGLPERIFDSPTSVIRQVASPAAAAALLDADAERDERIARALSWLESTPDAFLLTLADADYPRALLEIADPPILLYARGRRSCLTRPMLAIVGSRSATPQGLANAQTFARSLAREGLVIVSGMALGIDAAAHRGAMAAGIEGGATIAVIGTGIDRVYPSSHRELAQQIVADGLMLSEFALGVPALRENFPRRNRLISGLSLGVLVVEAAPDSGSLITARLAGEQGREVMAIPGSIHSEQARGCHKLIKQGAKLVESVADVLAELRVPLRNEGRPSATVTETAGADRPTAEVEQAGDPRHRPLLDSMGHDPCDIDELLSRTGLAIGTLNAALLELELQGLVARLPGGRFQRLVAV